MGGIHNWLEVCANNHRTVCNINPNTAMQSYNPVEANFQDIYVVEKTGTKRGCTTGSCGVCCINNDRTESALHRSELHEC